jgi:hypothetical protein
LTYVNIVGIILSRDKMKKKQLLIKEALIAFQGKKNCKLNASVDELSEYIVDFINIIEG